MKNETATWLRYANENLAVCRLSLERGLLNACLQNAQQCIEKTLKAVIVEMDLGFRKTHSIQKLAVQLTAAGLNIGLSEDECDLIDAIYLPSKYPIEAIVPDIEVDTDLCRECMGIAEKVLHDARERLGAAAG